MLMMLLGFVTFWSFERAEPSPFISLRFDPQGENHNANRTHIKPIPPHLERGYIIHTIIGIEYKYSVCHTHAPYRVWPYRRIFIGANREMPITERIESSRNNNSLLRSRRTLNTRERNGIYLFDDRWMMGPSRVITAIPTSFDGGMRGEWRLGTKMEKCMETS